jgi:glutamine synthetase
LRYAAGRNDLTCASNDNPFGCTWRDSIDALAADEVIKSSLPGDLYKIYDGYERDEWNRFIGETSDWDVKTYLDCLP